MNSAQEEPSIFQAIPKAHHALIRGAVLFSSPFIISLAIVLSLFPLSDKIPFLVLLIAAIILFFESKYSKIEFGNITSIVGGILYTGLFLVSLTNSSPLAFRIFNVIEKAIESTLNRAVIEVLAMGIFSIFAGLLVYFLLSIFTKSTIKYREGEAYAIGIIIFIVLLSIFFLDNNIFPIIEPYLKPIFGFSLLYAHINYLIERFRNSFMKK